MKANATIYREYRPKQNGECSIKIRVTHKGKRRYYMTNVSLLPEDFESVMEGDKRGWRRKISIQLNAYLAKANEIIEDLDIFTFSKFEEAYYENRNVNTSVSYAFDKYIKDLEQENRLGTAESYKYAKNSIESFKKNLEFADVTPRFLKRYENWMLKNERSISTVGIYLRSLRAIFNQQNIDSSLYPFGNGKGKYTIPTSRNIKKALTLKEIQKIYHYEPEENTSEEMARDYWIFLYLANGMNVKDFCLLRWENIKDNMITYNREKTKRTNSQHRRIEVALKPETLEIINKWGIRSLQEDAFIFPHLNDQMSAEEQRREYKQLTQLINKNMKRIAKKLEIDKEVTTYYARHSFATVLKRSGAQTEMISELLGHSDLRVTESYLDGFEKKQIQKQTDALTVGFKKAN